MPKTYHICIAPENSRRFKAWAQLLREHHKDVRLVTYKEIVEKGLELNSKLSYLIRIESPGEDFETYQLILKLGANKKNEEEKAKTLKNDFGAINKFNQWYRGWVKILGYLSEFSKKYPNIKFINHPESIVKVFNKFESQLYLQNNGVETPELFGLVNGFNHLVEVLHKYDATRAFLKPFYGSSASGIMAFQYINNQKQALYTTIEIADNLQFYNSLHFQKYHNPDTIKKVINYSLQQNYFVEKWLPKYRYGNLIVDFRVLVIKNKAEFIVPRGTQHIFTNLHLGNQKLELDALGFNIKEITKIKAIAEKAVACYPGLQYAGVDVLLGRDLNVYVLEINAFGDLLINITNKDGHNAYEKEYESLIT